MASWDKRRRLLFRWTTVSVVVTLATIALAYAVRDLGEETVLPGDQVDGLTSVLARKATSNVPFLFDDVTDTLGISFRHFPAERASQLPEDMGSGVACGDYDGDGFVDLFFVNMADNLLAETETDPSLKSSRLYRNIDGQRFEDVTDQAGVGFIGFGMGAAWGDYDDDGDLDLYVTAFGNNILYQNLGNGTFRDATAESGLQDTRFSAGCTWGDVDRDGDLDLYVCNYVEFIFREGVRGKSLRQYTTEQPYTLNPSAYAPQANALFINDGTGKFTDKAVDAKLDNPSGKSLSASWVDLNNDGWLDLYVANDVSNNGVYLNRSQSGSLHFEDVGPSSLAADYRGAMGIAVVDFDNDLDQDILITHWIAQENALYRNMTLDRLVGDEPTDRLWFMDEADTHGLGQLSLDMVGWATGFSDFNNDGLRDLWLINGSTLEQADNHRKLMTQRSFLFWNRGEEGFNDATNVASTVLSEPFVGRGGAALDFDRDGLIDLVFIRHGGDAVVLKNVTPNAHHWVRVRLSQTGRNTSALGARVYVTIENSTDTPGDSSTKTEDTIQMLELGSSSSYLSQDDPTLHFGLGDATRISELRIVWPDGVTESHTDLEVNQELTYTHAAAYTTTSD